MYKIIAILLCITSTCSINALEASLKENPIYPIAIIGSGAGGTMAAKRATLNNRQTLLFTGAKKEMKRSRGYWVKKVDNVPGLAKYKRTIVDLRNETLKEIANSPTGNKLRVINDSVVTIKKEKNFFTLVDKSGKSYRAQYVILATGMMDEQPQIKKKIKPVFSYANKQLIAYCLLCDGHKSFAKKTAVLGYSEDAAQSALTLKDRYTPSKVTLLTNGIKHTITQDTLKKLKDRGITIVNEPIESIFGSKSTRTLGGFMLKSGKKVDAEIGFVSLGVRPNNMLALQLDAKTDKKGLVVTDDGGESSVPNLFVIGDLRANSMKQIYTAWQHAVDSLQIIDRRIRANQ